MSVSLKVLAQLHSHGIINDKYVTLLAPLLERDLGVAHIFT
jgi:hypothetical protein